MLNVDWNLSSSPLKHLHIRLLVYERGEWIIKKNGESVVDIPNDLVIKVIDDSVSSIVRTTYPNLFENLDNLNYFKKRAILTLKQKNVDNINNYMLSLLPRGEAIYLNADTVCKVNGNVDSMDDLYTYEFLNSVRLFNFPNQLKV